MPINRFNTYGAGSATATDLRLDAARRQLGNNVKMVTLAGYSNAISNTTKWTPIAFKSSATFSAGGMTEIVSTDATDTTAVYFLEGVGVFGTDINEKVTLNGTTPVTLVNTYKWINTAQVIMSSSKGQINFLAGGAIFQSIEAKLNYIQNGAWAVPDGNSAVVDGLSVSVTANATDVSAWVGLWYAFDGVIGVQLCQIAVSAKAGTSNSYNIPQTLVPEYGSSILKATGALFYVAAKAIVSTSTISVVGNVLITKKIT